MSPIEGTMAEVQEKIINQVCAEHGEMVVCVWDAKAKVAMVKCARGEYPSRLKAVESKAVEARRDPAVVAPLGFGNWADRDLGDNHTLTIGELQALRLFAERYGLDADRGHVFVMFNKPYIGLDGYCYHAIKTGQHYVLGSRPLNPAEYKLYKINPGDYAWIAEGKLLEGGTEVMGLGIVKASELTEMSTRHPDRLRSPVVAAHPQLQAQKRAEWQWYRRAFPIGQQLEGPEDWASEPNVEKPEPTPEEKAARAAQVEKDSRELF